MAEQGFFHELRRRHVYRVAVAYVVVAWLLLQLSAILFPAFGAPHWAIRLLFAFLLLGFPVALLLAWVFEITPEGVRRTAPEAAEGAGPVGWRRWIVRIVGAAVVVMLVAAIGVLSWHRLGPKAELTAGVGSRSLTAAAATKIPAKSVAVLPFANDSANSGEQYFSDGLSEDLIIALSQYPGLKVIGRESSFQLRHTRLDSEQIGLKLGVAHLLEGSVSREDDEVRVRAELVNTGDGATLWSDLYDRPYKNLFALQDDITKAVATALKAKLLGSARAGAVVQTDRPPSGSLAAYNAYLKGNFYFNQFTEKSLRKAIAAYRSAVKKDPKYAAAFAQLSLAWTNLGGGFLNGSAVEDAYVKARSAADTAVKLDPHSAAAFGARGFLLLSKLDWRDAETAFQQAVELDPASPDGERLLAISLATLGRLAEAVRLGRKAAEANPLDARAYFDLAQYLAAYDRLTDARDAIRRAISLRPTAATYHASLAAIDTLRGDARAALAAAKAEPDPSWHAWALALAYWAAGDKTQADRALHTLISKYADGAAYQIVDVYAYRKQPDQAFAWLDRAWRERDPGISYLLFDPFMLRYKNDPRFAKFCRNVGLPVPGATVTSADVAASAAAARRR